MKAWQALLLASGLFAVAAMGSAGLFNIISAILVVLAVVTGFQAIVNDQENSGR